MSAPYKAKICGTTTVADAWMAAKAGADYVGIVVEAAFSPRALTIDEAQVLFSSPPIPPVALVFQMERRRIEHLIKMLNPFAIQFLGDSSPLQLQRIKNTFPSIQIWQSIHLPQTGAGLDIDTYKKIVARYLDIDIDAILLDTAVSTQGRTKFGGTGVPLDWAIAGQLIRWLPPTTPVWLAGGINPDNVSQAIATANPFGIDLCSGVESTPGKKDPSKINALMDAIRKSSTTRRKIT